MKDKTDANIAAAELLIRVEEGCHCNASIHCSYYAVLQYMKYLLHNLNKNKIEYEQQKTDKQGSHDFIYNEILKRFNGNPSNLKKYKEYFLSLKSHRVKADYTHETFLLEECSKCYNMAFNLIKILRNDFISRIA